MFLTESVMKSLNLVCSPFFWRRGALLGLALLSAQGCASSSSTEKNYKTFEEILVPITQEVGEKTFPLLVAQCALAVQGKPIDRDALFRAGYEEKFPLIGSNAYYVFKAGDIPTVTLNPYGYDGCTLSAHYGEPMRQYAYNNMETFLRQNGFVRLKEDGGIFGTLPRYRINGVTVVLTTGVFDGGVSYTFDVE